ncbi:hypothetical protein NL676_019676 [Syzygium grande]|nr:hypothetical protein NL676_019676 [Syzygium grande]
MHDMQEIILAAVDNPSNAVEWAMAEMINQPELLHKATEEIDRVVGKERLVQESDIPQLNYIKACAREAFRLHPIAPFNVPHVALSDTVVAGYRIPKGSHVLLSRVGLGRNPRFGTNPLSSSQTDTLLIQGFSWSKPSNLSSINLAESRNDLFLAEPLSNAEVKAAEDLASFPTMLQQLRHRRTHLNSILFGCEQCPRLARSSPFDACCRCSDKELLSEITTAKVSPQQPTGAASSRFSSESPPAPLQVPNVIFEPNQPIYV